MSKRRNSKAKLTQTTPKLQKSELKNKKYGIVTNKIGVKLRKQPPPLPKSFETSPLFDMNQT